jgi:hypothetical protein
MNEVAIHMRAILRRRVRDWREDAFGEIELLCDYVLARDTVYSTEDREVMTVVLGTVRALHRRGRPCVDDIITFFRFAGTCDEFACTLSAARHMGGIPLSVHLSRCAYLLSRSIPEAAVYNDTCVWGLIKDVFDIMYAVQPPQETNTDNSF